ncbi:serine/threonine protein kinase [Nitrogeniibacter mangrovi]|uniref:Stress response kinase A n=1 Tax=Nitrogeniibacter mangrovi TaxID=2016596 RepID=A0A6C1B774_9RHOO|nr:serine/threonine protein kinase [Nitrogeniibacter mangrovi]QID19612.1 serine/threonine protein kinase [Nitrogeniibacter mangrovi]
MTDTEAPFARLTPDALLDALEAIGLPVNGSVLALNSYENRVFQVGVDDGAPLIAKFYRPGRWSDEAIGEEHAFLHELAEREIPVVAPLALDGRTLHQAGGYRIAVFPRRGGRAPELEDEDVLRWMGRFMARVHAVGATKPFAHRPVIDRQTYGIDARDALLRTPYIPMELETSWRSVVDQALDGVERCYQRAGDIALIRLHGDCHAGNVLWTPDGPHFVDFDDARMGPAIQDLWMLLTGQGDEQRRQFEVIFEGYRQFADFNPAERQLAEALRTLRLIHYAAWIAQRWHDPAFPHAFSWFDSPRYWQDHILALREQIALMDEPPLM